MTQNHRTTLKRNGSVDEVKFSALLFQRHFSQSSACGFGKAAILNVQKLERMIFLNKVNKNG